MKAATGVEGAVSFRHGRLRLGDVRFSRSESSCVLAVAGAMRAGSKPAGMGITDETGRRWLLCCGEPGHVQVSQDPLNYQIPVDHIQPARRRG